jgi:predicted nucleotidyltransferase
MKKEIVKTAKLLVKKLSKFNYAFIGSLNLHMQGINIKPRDIDILTTEKEVFKIEKELKKYLTKETYFDKEDGRNSYRSFYNINGVEVEILGNVNNLCRPKNIMKKKVNIKYQNLKIPVIPLVEELDFYTKCKRNDRSKAIEEFLKNNK